MLEAISAYIRNIAVFLIFAGFVRVLLPDGKYREYINLTLAFILVLITAAPLIGLLGGEYTDVFFDFGVGYDKNVMALEHEGYDETQSRLVLEAYAESLKEQLERLVKSCGYVFAGAVFILGDGEENFGEILRIDVEVYSEPEKEEKKPLIRIETVRIGSNTLPGYSGEEAGGDAGTGILKKAISDFYNIVQDNIYIAVRGIG